MHHSAHAAIYTSVCVSGLYVALSWAFKENGALHQDDKLAAGAFPAPSRDKYNCNNLQLKQSPSGTAGPDYPWVLLNVGGSQAGKAWGLMALVN